MATRFPRSFLVLLLLALALAPQVGSRAAAANLTFTVTTPADAPDAHTGDGVCADASNRCTLRAAVQEANAQPSGSTITVKVPAGTYRLMLGALALINNTIVMSGVGARTTLVDGQNRSQVLTVSGMARAFVAGVTIMRGTAGTGSGGGIANAGTLVLSRSALIGNVAGQGGGLYNGPNGHVALIGSLVRANKASTGGGIANSGTATVAYSKVIGNTTATSGVGGGIDNSGIMTLTNSTLSHNSTSGNGGGIENSGTAMLSSSTLNGNVAGNIGGGIENGGTLTVRNSTLSGNAANYQGGGIENRGTMATTTLSYVTVAANSDGITNPLGTVKLTGTIVANSTLRPNCQGSIAESLGYNLDSSTSCGFSQTTDLTKTNPLLGPLQNNGGPTPTMALLPGSLAIDHGGSSANGCPATDQRSVPRPQGPACDIGAYEAVPGAKK